MGPPLFPAPPRFVVGGDEWNITYTDPRETHPLFRYPTLLNMGETDCSLHEAPMHTLPTQRPHGDTLAQRRAPVRERPGDHPPVFLCVHKRAPSHQSRGPLERALSWQPIFASLVGYKVYHDQHQKPGISYSHSEDAARGHFSRIRWMVSAAKQTCILPVKEEIHS